MSTTDLKRAEALAGLFTAPATAVPDQATSPAARPSRGKRPARTLSVVEEPGAGESSPATAVAEAVGVLDTVIVIEPGGTPAEAAGSLLEEADASHPTDDFDEDESAVEAMSTVITIPTDEEADELHEMAAEAAAVEQEAASQDEAPPQVDLVEVLTKKLGLKGAAERHNVPVAESTRGVAEVPGQAPRAERPPNRVPQCAHHHGRRHPASSPTRSATPALRAGIRRWPCSRSRGGYPRGCLRI